MDHGMWQCIPNPKEPTGQCTSPCIGLWQQAHEGRSGCLPIHHQRGPYPRTGRRWYMTNHLLLKIPFGSWKELCDSWSWTSWNHESTQRMASLYHRTPDWDPHRPLQLAMVHGQKGSKPLTSMMGDGTVGVWLHTQIQKRVHHDSGWHPVNMTGP